MSTRKPEMKGILEPARPKTGRRKSVQNFRKFTVTLLAIGILASFFYGVIHLGDFLVAYPSVQPAQPFLFPLLAVIMILTLLPLMFYVSFQDDFGDINPLLPTHYMFLAKKAFAAIIANDFKVSAKDL